MNYAKKENDMPIDEFEKLGLYENGVFHLSSEDLEALKRGRRTSMITLRNFNIDGFSVSSIDAKVSLRKNSQGESKINIHPIYREPQLHPLLDDNEQQSLIEGKKQFIRKQVEAKRDKKENVIIEYDRSTREFVTYFPSQVTAPIKVNNEELTRAQQLDFCNGEVVTLKDGTRIQHSASDNKGVRSDNQRLIVSVLLDGGISYLIFRGILNLKGHFQQQSNGYSEGYNQAMTEMILADKRKINDKIGLNFEQASNDAPQTRSYGHPFPR